MSEDMFSCPLYTLLDPPQHHGHGEIFLQSINSEYRRAEAELYG
jgi:hypothetical protein